MQSDRILAELRRRPILRRFLSLAGYVGGAAALVYGGALFHAEPALSDDTLAAGFWLVGGIVLMGATHELRVAIRALPARKPDPIES